MATKIKIIRTFDISLPNEVFNLHEDKEYGELKLSAASLTVSEKSYEASVVVLDFICKSAVKNMPEYAFWLLLGNSAWQPNTRLVRYLGLWGGLKSRGIEMPQVTRSVERIVERDGKLRFFGAMCLSDFSDRKSIEVLLTERCSYIAILPKNFDIECVLDLGWCGGLSEDQTLCAYVGERKGLLIMRVGEFDDPDNGFVSVGEQGVLNDLLS
jgi:hypothetical protein